MIIEIRNLTKSFGRQRAVDHLDLLIEQGESLGLVGESGSGKTTLARLILGLIEPEAGTIEYPGIANLRRDCQIVFQDPQTSLNPRIRIGEAIREPLIVHGVQCTVDRVRAMLYLVKLPANYADRFPHELSGGERQRVGIARSLILNPKFLILDEPVSSLDVVIQLDILNLLKEVKQKLNLTYLFIAHDLSVIGYMCDRIAVMQNGRLVELGSKDQILNDPREEYTKKLLSSVLPV